MLSPSRERPDATGLKNCSGPPLTALPKIIFPVFECNVIVVSAILVYGCSHQVDCWRSDLTELRTES